jgi:hypothetical protein
MRNPLNLPWLKRAQPLTPLAWMVAAVLLWRLVLLAIGWWADAQQPYAPSFPYATELLIQQALPSWLSKWASFDGVHYLTIMQRGYLGTGLIQAFFPVFPFTVLLLAGSASIAGLITTGLLLNLLLAIYLAWIAQRLLRLDVGSVAARWGVLALFLFPTSFFLAALYSETLYLALSLTALFLIRKRRWWWAAGLILVASATRITGVFLVLALLVEWAGSLGWHASKLKRQLPKMLVIASVASLGLVSYMAYLWWQFSDPIYFLNVQSEFGGGRSETLVTYPQVVWRYLKMFATVRPFDWKFYAIVAEFLAGVLPLLALFRWGRQLRLSYLVYGLACFLLPTLTGTFSSMPRYLLVVWPVFLGLAVWSKAHRTNFILYLLFSSLLLIINTVLFIQGIWVA